jgi:ABC-type antimicrobial peptide transport system permease subunit
VQSAVVALIAFVIGVPLGLLLASIAWQLVAGELIVVPVVHIDWRLLAGAASLTLGLTIVIGLAVGERTQRKRPAELLRAE